MTRQTDNIPDSPQTWRFLLVMAGAGLCGCRVQNKGNVMANITIPKEAKSYAESWLSYGRRHPRPAFFYLGKSKETLLSFLSRPNDIRRIDGKTKTTKIELAECLGYVTKALSQLTNPRRMSVKMR